MRRSVSSRTTRNKPLSHVLSAERRWSNISFGMNVIIPQGGDSFCHLLYYVEMTYKDGSWGKKARERSSRRTQYFYEYQKKRRSLNESFVPKGSIKRNARQKVRDHILAGKIIKPKRCSTCNKKKELEAHHSDYSKPLDIQWLCKQCHISTHKSAG